MQTQTPQKQTHNTNIASVTKEKKTSKVRDRTHVINSPVANRFIHALIDACTDIEVNEQTFELHEEVIDTIVVLASTQVCFFVCFT